LWATYDKVEWDPRHHARFLGNEEFMYVFPLAAEKKLKPEEEPPSPEKDDTADCLGYLTYSAEKAKEEGTEDHLYVMSEGVDEGETLRLAMMASELQRTPSA
jgi:hypothetical protein